jgi:hypothetical protein
VTGAFCPDALVMLQRTATVKKTVSFRIIAAMHYGAKRSFAFDEIPTMRKGA